jgi:hypothetical protein
MEIMLPWKQINKRRQKLLKLSLKADEVCRVGKNRSGKYETYYGTAFSVRHRAVRHATVV